MQSILSAGYPTKEERLIFGLGLGGSGQIYDQSVAVPFLWSRIRTSNAYDVGTRCPHTHSAGEVCQRLSGMTLNIFCMSVYIDEQLFFSI